MSDQSSSNQPANATSVDEQDEKQASLSSIDSAALHSSLSATLQAAQAAAASNLATVGGSIHALAATPQSLTISEVIREERGTNARTILCKFCDTKILTPDAATYQQKEIHLHLLNGSKDDPSVELLHDHWCVLGQMQFENVAVTRTGTGTGTGAGAGSSAHAQQSNGSFRYLTCANCDRGPIGINYLDDPQRFFVAHQRVKYAQ